MARWPPIAALRLLHWNIFMPFLLPGCQLRWCETGYRRERSLRDDHADVRNVLQIASNYIHHRRHWGQVRKRYARTPKYFGKASYFDTIWRSGQKWDRQSIDVNLNIMEENGQSFLSMKEIRYINLEMLIIGKVMRSGNKTPKLNFENYVLVHRWKHLGGTYTFYTYKELYKWHKNFWISIRQITCKSNWIGKPTKGPAYLPHSRECKPCLQYVQERNIFAMMVQLDCRNQGIVHQPYSINIHDVHRNSSGTTYMVDLGIPFATEKFLTRQSTSDIWQYIQRMSNMDYIRLHD